MKKPKYKTMPANYKTIRIMCSNCGDFRLYQVDLVFGTAGLAKQLYQEGFRYNGATYCPHCVKTWPQRNGIEYDKAWKNMEKEFAQHLAEVAY